MGTRNLMWGPCLWCFGERLSPQLRRWGWKAVCQTQDRAPGQACSERAYWLLTQPLAAAFPFVAYRNSETPLAVNMSAAGLFVTGKKTVKSSKSTCGES